jgi:hypothetical protein
VAPNFKLDTFLFLFLIIFSSSSLTVFTCFSNHTVFDFYISSQSSRQLCVPSLFYNGQGRNSLLSGHRDTTDFGTHVSNRIGGTEPDCTRGFCDERPSILGTKVLQSGKQAWADGIVDAGVPSGS